ncbi:DUF4421 domain-containing protein [Siphonobacter sp. SORGH_AS_0500]|uniref:DUF4421 domain-containing protein n=1 Tax=Siphonobacter sp. SORGH_AS_0500 TaxID=1864824 RepID=UPI00285FA4E2|nr:DUF4421 domain-containing protein [Siphonobacter sp. SORGH_AS_0500]MDR6195446.1 hypothetical protein [Siphonobacter sp. SORGH_AS_0500]
MFRFFCFFLFCLCWATVGWTQELDELVLQTKESVHTIDTTYIKSFERQLAARVYLSQKYSRLLIKTPSSKIAFHPNSSLNLGIGATYESVTLNLALGFPFLNPERGQGKSKYLDLQSHLYNRNWVADIYGQFYKGYYLTSQSLADNIPEPYYQRPDVYLRMGGVSYYRLTNGNRFSYRAALVQNEWQKKSAGTWLYGAEIFYGAMGGDSTLAPTAYIHDFKVSKIRFFKLGPGGGYAYTWVMNRHFFVTGSLTANLNLSMSSENTGNAFGKVNVHVRPNFNYRASIGYNSEKWMLKLSLVQSDVSVNGASDTEYLVRTGNYRFTYTRRFPPGRKLRNLADQKRKLLGN